VFTLKLDKSKNFMFLVFVIDLLEIKKDLDRKVFSLYFKIINWASSVP
jgi:hypothetical protein